ncbi:hypothetical protein JTE90_010222 [Oedothorax gibbosus]|uniref:ER-bound oxygenase mpaB/mpaB'/Rubber oxygenase catalytic domain-containing protein n=1 Tax=Oedothorax gibbosus TaxID=931172 RepID=A0AAV6UJ58_9ARAC|nr:hypothetical protein JTE90_010222 [Oedothorax gibbosus]
MLLDGEKRLGELQIGDSVPTPGLNKTTSDEPKFPEWFDAKKFQRAKDVYRDHFASVNFGHLCGLLLSFYFTKNIVTLRSTGNSENRNVLFRRYLSTVQHVRGWYEGDVWDKQDAARKSLDTVRTMHARVAQRMRQRQEKARKEGADHVESNSKTEAVVDAHVDVDAVYVSQWDMAVTQWAFAGTLVLFKDKVGLGCCSAADLEALVHFWRGIGWLLGIEDAYNLCGGEMAHVEAACRAMLETEYAPRAAAPHPASTRMVVGVVDALKLLDPTLSPAAMQAYCRDLVGVSPGEELSWADWACHALTSFFMRHAMRYETPRRMLNGLTRWRLDHADTALEAPSTGVTGG